MNVSVMRLRPGNLDVPRTFAGGESPAGRGPGGTRVESAPREVARSAWFDFNGDGTIDNANPLYGGDGTLLGFDIPAPPPRAHKADLERRPTPAAVDHAHDSYRRYSQPEKPVQVHAKAAVA